MISLSSTLNSQALNEESTNQTIHRNVKKAFVCVNNPVFTCIPSSLYEHNKAKDYFKFIQHISDDDILFENQFELAPYHILFPVKQNVVRLFRKKNPSVEFYHYVYILGSRLLKEKYPESSCVLISKQSAYFYLFICKNKKIILLSSFKTINDNNISYFTLNGLHANNIDLKDTRLFYSGIKNIKDQYISILNQYIPNVQALSASKQGNIKNTSL